MVDLMVLKNISTDFRCSTFWVLNLHTMCRGAEKKKSSFLWFAIQILSMSKKCFLEGKGFKRHQETCRLLHPDVASTKVRAEALSPYCLRLPLLKFSLCLRGNLNQMLTMAPHLLSRTASTAGGWELVTDYILAEELFLRAQKSGSSIGILEGLETLRVPA